MKVRFSRQASSDLTEIKAYHEQEGRAATLHVRGAILAAVEILRRRPAIGIRTAMSADLRSKLVVGYPYRIHYRVRDGALEIFHVRHTARQPWRGVGE